MPMISNMMSSNMVHDRAKVKENKSCVVMLCTCSGGQGRGGEDGDGWELHKGTIGVIEKDSKFRNA